MLLVWDGVFCVFLFCFACLGFFVVVFFGLVLFLVGRLFLCVFECMLVTWKKTCSFYKSSQQRLHLKHLTFQSIITHINSVG